MILVAVALLVAAAPGTSQAQETCGDVAARIVNETAANCAGLERDAACFAGSVMALTELPGLVSNGFADDNYGVALLNTSVDLPVAMGNQGVMMLMLGDVRLENAVPQADVVTPMQPIEVRTTGSVNLRSRPSTNDTVLTSVSRDTLLPADALSVDEEWLRVVHEGIPAWVSRSVIDSDGLDDLPVVGLDDRTLMQDFSLDTNPQTTCAGAPNALVIQGVETQPTRLSVNGAEMRIRETVAVSSYAQPFEAFTSDSAWMDQYESLLPEGETDDETICRFTRLAAIDGDAFLNDYRFSIPRGYQALAFHCEGDEDDILWGRADPIGGQTLQQFAVLNALPAGVLRYEINVATPAEIGIVRSQLNQAANNDEQPATTGENTDDADTSADDTTNANLASGECPGFQPTHPLTGVAFGYVRFYWDPAAGASSYAVNVYNHADELIDTYNVSAPSTSARVSTISQDFYQGTNRQPPMSWEVLAYQDGQLLCSTPRIYITRDFDPDPDCPPWLWFTGECEDYIANEP